MNLKFRAKVLSLELTNGVALTQMCFIAVLYPKKYTYRYQHVNNNVKYRMVIKNNSPAGFPEECQQNKPGNIQHLKYRYAAEIEYKLRFDFFWKCNDKSGKKAHHA